ncbi:hypothetical protein Cabys_51 [Caldithrix abyssi DSM 13497]|uniref:Uncharacterized protein n=1 Tax=Caldithrix abyssi DSM 13497 TaxID=880073 RepID=A0A1J1C452_CALAY|nr:hypothetical protein Cabys_51 [Caldithrix abyssi DSM 13497]
MRTLLLLRVLYGFLPFYFLGLQSSPEKKENVPFYFKCPS